nr:uncharacterized protein LOC118682855 [Bactrocera oleae]
MLPIPDTPFIAYVQCYYGALPTNAYGTCNTYDNTRILPTLTQSPVRTVSPTDNRIYTRTRKIAERIGVEEIKVRIWFKNRRAKDKKRPVISTSISAENGLSTIGKILENINNPNGAATSSGGASSLKTAKRDDVDEIPAIYVRQKASEPPPPPKKHKVEVLEHLVFYPATNNCVRIRRDICTPVVTTI